MLFRCSPVALVVNPLMGPMEAMGASTNEPLHKSHKIVIWDDLKQRSMIELEFSHEIKAVKLRRDKIIVVLPQMVKVYTFTSSPTQLNVYDTAPNQKGKFFSGSFLFTKYLFTFFFSFLGLCSLSPTSDKALLAFPITTEQSVSAIVNNKISASGVGRVQIVDLANPDNQHITIVAHDTK